MTELCQITVDWDILEFKLIIEKIALNYMIWKRLLYPRPFILLYKLFPLLLRISTWVDVFVKVWDNCSRHVIQLHIIHHEYFISNNQYFWREICHSVICTCWKAEIEAFESFSDYLNLISINTVVSVLSILDVEKCNI